MTELSIHPLEELSQILAPPARLAALDIGTKTIGIALATPDWQMVTPLTTITRGKWAMDLAALEKALDGHGVKGLIVGLPLNMDDTEGPRTQGVKQVVFNIIKADPAWLKGGMIAFCDERLSSNTAHDQSAHLSLKHAKSTGALDALAAVDILERAIRILKEQP
jgi:putative Holliday junction resolvase